jgi:hypothetical protein
MSWTLNNCERNLTNNSIWEELVGGSKNRLVSGIMGQKPVLCVPLSLAVGTKSQ